MIPVGPFQLQAPLAQGGTAEVWRGIHREQRVPVAVKVFRAGWSRASHRRRLEAEIRAVAALSHPHVVWVYDHGTFDDEAAERVGVHPGTPWLAMELAEGGTLSQRARGFDWWDLRETLLPLLDALGHAHARGVVHRDLKPGNVLYGGARPGPKLSDFGVAFTGEAAPSAGTPGYMAPEQRRPERWHEQGPWTDLFALGAMTWRIVAGRFPWPDEPQRTCPRLAPRFAVPEALEAWLGRMLALQPGDRFQRAADAAAALGTLGHPLWSRSRAVHRGPPPLPAEPPASDPGAPLPLRGAGLGLFGLRALPVAGRDTLKERLWGALRGVHATGRPALRVLRGPAGSGKSTLAAWLAHSADAVGGAVVVRVDHDATKPGTGLGAALARRLGIAALRRDLARQRVAAWLRDRGVSDPDELEVQTEALRPATAHDLEAGAARVRFEGAMERHAVLRRHLALLARDRPALLWLEDAHWGADSLAFAERLLEGEPPVPRVLVVATARDDLLLERPAERDALASLAERPGAGTLEVGALSDGAMSTLVANLLGLEPALARQVAERTAGNPLFAVQLVGDWVARGVLVPAGDGFRLRAGAPPSLPPSVARVWQSRVQRLLSEDPGWRDPLWVAGVLGQHVDVPEWEAACAALGRPAPPELVDRLVDQGLATVAPEERGRRWSLGHSMLRETLLESAREAGRLESLHRACAEALASAAEIDVRGRCARHRIAAGQPAAALELLTEVARARWESAAYQRARDDLRLREAVLEQLAVADDDPRWGSGWLLQARCAFRLGDPDDVERLCERLRDRSELRGWERVRLGWLTFDADRTLAAGNRPEALALARRVRADLPDDADLELRHDVLMVFGRALSQSGHGEEAAAVLRAAAEAGTTAYQRASAWLELATPYLNVSKDWDAARRALERGQAEAAQAGSRYLQAKAAYFRGAVEVREGRLEAAEALYLEARGHFEAFGGRVGYLTTRLAVAVVRIRLGSLAGLREELEELLGDPALQRYQRCYVHLCAVVCLAPEPDERTWRTHLDGIGEWEFMESDFCLLLELAGQRAHAAGYLERAREVWERAVPLWRPHDAERADALATRAAELGR